MCALQSKYVKTLFCQCPWHFRSPQALVPFFHSGYYSSSFWLLNVIDTSKTKQCLTIIYTQAQCSHIYSALSDKNINLTCTNVQICIPLKTFLFTTINYRRSRSPRVSWSSRNDSSAKQKHHSEKPAFQREFHSTSMYMQVANSVGNFLAAQLLLFRSQVHCGFKINVNGHFLF